MCSYESLLAAIGLVSLNSNSETHMTAICDARLIDGRGRISPVFRFICGAVLSSSDFMPRIWFYDL